MMVQCVIYILEKERIVLPEEEKKRRSETKENKK